jgi:hypothetical protein
VSFCRLPVGFNHSGSDSPKLASLEIVLSLWVATVLIPQSLLRFIFDWVVES